MINDKSLRQETAPGFITRGRELSYEEVDSNWVLLQEALNGKVDLVSGTVAEITALSGSYTPGGFYLVTNPSQIDQGVLLQAVHPFQLSTTGTGLFFNCDYQGEGNYVGVEGVTTVPYTSAKRIWQSTDTYDAGDVVIFQDAVGDQQWHHYQNITGSATGSPDQDPTNWEKLPRQANCGYILRADQVEYDLILDAVLRRTDGRQMVDLANPNQDTTFLQYCWGNAQIYEVQGSFYSFNCLSNMVALSTLTLGAGSAFSIDETSYMAYVVTVGAGSFALLSGGIQGYVTVDQGSNNSNNTGIQSYVTVTNESINNNNSGTQSYLRIDHNSDNSDNSGTQGFLTVQNSSYNDENSGTQSYITALNNSSNSYNESDQQYITLDLYADNSSNQAAQSQLLILAYDNSGNNTSQANKYLTSLT